MNERTTARIDEALGQIRADGVWKDERIIASPQGASIEVGGQAVLNFCANNYLGLSSHPDIVKAAHETLDSRGYGMSSVRFICGTTDLHRELECRISGFLGTEDTILYTSCFDANGGLFETLLGPEDSIIADRLNHASIIDGVRLAKVPKDNRHIYKHADMADLEEKLKAAQGCRDRMIVTDGVFSMDGDTAPLDAICDLAERYDALLCVDDSHATGFVGPKGRGTPEMYGVQDRVDIVTSTLGKALGGASGGFTTGRGPIIKLLRQRSRPYLFSNSVPPPIVGASLAALDLLEGSTERRDRLEANAQRFRSGMEAAGFELKPGSHPIIPVMLYDAQAAQNIAADLLEQGIYVTAFTFPVVPRKEDRIRVQLSAEHTDEQIDRCIAAFTEVGKKHGVLKD
ncbi:MAG: glycine C-acetyltransferase [Planctomycetota bacterium]